MTRDELIDLVRRIMAAEGGTQEEVDRLVDLFLENVPHPEADGLIFYPEQHFGHEPTAEEVVDGALTYRPIELEPEEGRARRFFHPAGHRLASTDHHPLLRA